MRAVSQEAKCKIEHWGSFKATDMLKIKYIIAPLSDIPMFYIIYLTMHKVHNHVGAKRKLLYGCSYVWEIIQSIKLVGYLPVHTHKPYSNHLIIYYTCITISEAGKFWCALSKSFSVCQSVRPSVRPWFQQ